MDLTQYPLFAWFVYLISGDEYELALESPLLGGMFIFGSIVLILMTVSFLFKFILKLVDR